MNRRELFQTVAGVAVVSGVTLAGVKAVVLTDGLTLTLIDSAGHVLNRRLDDA